MRALVDKLKRRLLGTTHKQWQQVAALLNAIEPNIASGDRTAADARCQDAEVYLRKLEGDDTHPDTRRICGAAYFDLGSAYRRMRRVADAEASYAKAAELLDSISGVPTHSHFAAMQLAACQNQLGLLYMDCGPPEKAIAALDAAIEMRRQLARRRPDDDENKVYLGGALCNRAHLARDLGDVMAGPCYDEAIQVLNNAVPPCACGAQEVIVDAISQAMGTPHWIALANQFRANAEEGKRLLTSV